MYYYLPIIIALIINICRRHCCVKPQNNRLLINSGDMYNLDGDQQALFDPPPSYNLLFGHSQTSSSSEHLLVNAANTSETISSQGDQEQISIHTLPSSNSISMDSVTLTEADNCYRQFRDRVKRFPGFVSQTYITNAHMWNTIHLHADTHIHMHTNNYTKAFCLNICV
jgi:hypothetical protein